jgi:superfamily II DNA or RNA helicase
VIILRDYQETGLTDIRAAFGSGHRAPLYVAPTGSGKTALFSMIAHGAAAKGNQVMILSHRVELVDQISAALDRSATPHGFIAAGYPTHAAQCMIASVATLIRRQNDASEPNLIIVDEAHHARAKTWEGVLSHWPRAKLLGFTATPVRTSGEGLGKIFDCLILGPTVADLTPQYLAPARVWAPPSIDTSGLHTVAGEYIASESEERANKPSVTGDALSHYRKHADGKAALAFCVSVKHASDVAAYFRDAGYSAVMLKGGMDRQLRRDAIADFRVGKIQIVASCDLLTEGVDFPGAHVGIILRPTQSLGLWRQMCGRILRPCEGKEYAYILDHAGNCKRWGLPSDEPEWTLTMDEERRKKKASVSVRVCPKCFAASSARALSCSNCGEQFAVAPRSMIEEKDGELVEITPEMIEKKRERQTQGRMQTIEELRDYCRKRGWHPDRALHIMRGRQRKAGRA